MTLTKKELTRSIQHKLGFTEKLSIKMVESVLDLIKSSLENGDDVLVSGFGKFCIKDKRERKGGNPATGEDMLLAPRRVATFRCSRKLRDRVNGKR